MLALLAVGTCTRDTVIISSITQLGMGQFWRGTERPMQESLRAPAPWKVFHGGRSRSHRAERKAPNERTNRRPVSLPRLKAYRARVRIESDSGLLAAVPLKARRCSYALALGWARTTQLGYEYFFWPESYSTFVCIIETRFHS